MTASISLQINQAPIQNGGYVRAADTPAPYQDEFIADSRGSTMPLPDGESGACFFAHDYRKWLTYRSSPAYAPRFQKSCPAGARDE